MLRKKRNKLCLAEQVESKNESNKCISLKKKLNSVRQSSGRFRFLVEQKTEKLTMKFKDRYGVTSAPKGMFAHMAENRMDFVSELIKKQDVSMHEKKR